MLMRPYKVKQLDLDMNLIKVWDSVKLAGIGLSIAKENIQSVLGNDCSTIAEGFKWEYVHKPNKKYNQLDEGFIKMKNINKTGFRGVTANKNGTFECTYTDNDKKYIFYHFKTSEDAARHYDKVSWKLSKKQYLLNFTYNSIKDIEDVNLEETFKVNITTKCGHKFINTNVNPNKNTYSVLINTNGRTKHYGTFKTVEEAIIKRDTVLLEMGKTL
jgi:hypothetical protein